jgi:hypothetical protein
VPAELEQDHQLAEPPPVRRLGDLGRGVVRTERAQRVDVEVGTVPVAGDDRLKHRPLLCGDPAVDVDSPEEDPTHRLDQAIRHDSRHEETLAKPCHTYSPGRQRQERP